MTMFPDTTHRATSSVDAFNASEFILHCLKKMGGQFQLNANTLWCIFGLRPLHTYQLLKWVSNKLWEPKRAPRTLPLLRNHLESVCVDQRRCLKVLAMKIMSKLKFQFFHPVYSSRSWSRFHEITPVSKFCKFAQLWFQFPRFRLHREEWP